MALLDPVRSLGLSRGVFGNSRFWLVLGGLAWGVRAVNWVRRPNARTVFRQAIEPGQTLVISAHGPPPGKGSARAGRRAERLLARRETRGTIATARMRRRHRVL